MDEQAKLTVKINAAVMLILKTHKEQISRLWALKSIKDEEAMVLTSSSVGMIFRRIFPMVSMLAFTLRILAGTILVNKK